MISVWTLSTFCISVDVKLALIFNAIFVYLFQLQTAFSLSWAGVGWWGGGGGGSGQRIARYTNEFVYNCKLNRVVFLKKFSP